MLEFDNIEDLQNNKDLQNMGRYCWDKVKLNGKEVFACTTNQQYEDIIFGETYEMLKHLFEHFNINTEQQDIADYTTSIRDFVLDLLRENGIEFVDVFDEY